MVCFTESDWERLALKTEDSDNKDVQALHQVITEDFLPEIPRLFEEKERLQRKRMLEMQPRRQSTRLEKLKQKEERKKYEDLCREQEETNKKKENKKKRQEKRPKAKEGGLSDSEAESHGYSSSSSKKTGRQTNNSLASATGQIVIDASQEKPGTKTTSKTGLVFFRINN